MQKQEVQKDFREHPLIGKYLSYEPKTENYKMN